MKGNGNGGTRRPEDIQADIQRTRSEMDRTLSAIEHRLTPGQLVDQGIDYLKHSGARDYIANLGGSVKENPLPVALASIGLAWLMAVHNRPVQYKFVETGQRSYGEGAGHAMDTAREGMRSAREGMHSMKDKVSSGMQSMKDTATSAREKVSQWSDTARGQAERARSGWDSMVNEHPLAIGAIGLALGAVFAAMAPRTQREDEMMGEARDRLFDKAREAGTEKLEQARDVAKEKLDSAKEQMKSPASTSGSTPASAPAVGADGTPRGSAHGPRG